MIMPASNGLLLINLWKGMLLDEKNPCDYDSRRDCCISLFSTKAMPASKAFLLASSVPLGTRFKTAWVIASLDTHFGHATTAPKSNNISK